MKRITSIAPEAHVWGDLARHHAAVRGDQLAFIGTDASFSFAEVNARINRLCQALTALGLRHGDRVAILSRNRPEYFEVYGVAKAGFVSVPLNWRLSARELRHPLADSEPVAIVAEPAYVPVTDELASGLPSIRHRIVFGAAGRGWQSYEALLATASAQEPHALVREDDPLCIVYSSGTTGVPKGALVTHRGALGNCRVVGRALLGIGEQDVGLAVMPIFHVGGMWYHLFPSFASGGRTVILPEFDPRRVLAAMAQHAVTHVHLVPTMIGALLNEPDVAGFDLAQLRTIYYAASSIPLVLLKRALATFGHCGFVQSYGSTEAGSVTALMPEDHMAAAGDPAREHLLLSCGRPLAGAEVAIRGFDGAPAGTDEIGDIVVRSDRIMVGYWRNAEATRTVMNGGWLLTGDVGRIDADGFVYIVDRRHDMIVTGGENVYPREVEDVLCDDPDVAEAAVFALPDPKWVERVTAAIVLRPGCAPDAEAIRAHATRRLASYKCPKTLFFVNALPKNASGKILKRELRRRYASGADGPS